jgi:hypothetical protein
VHDARSEKMNTFGVGGPIPAHRMLTAISLSYGNESIDQTQLVRTEENSRQIKHACHQ